MALRPECRCSEPLARRLPRRAFSSTGGAPQQSVPFSPAPHKPVETTASAGSDAFRHAGRCASGLGANGAAAERCCWRRSGCSVRVPWWCDQAGSPCRSKQGPGASLRRCHPHHQALERADVASVAGAVGPLRRFLKRNLNWMALRHDQCFC